MNNSRTSTSYRPTTPDPSTISVHENRSSAVQRSATDAVAGALSGALARTVVAPVDRIKLLRQLTPSIVTSAAANGSRSSDVLRNKSALHVLRGIVKQEGFFSLWRGNQATIATEASSAALNFVFLERYKELITAWILDQQQQQYQQQEQRQQRLYRSLVSGGAAGATTLTFLYPLGFMRTRLAVDLGHTTRQFGRGMRDVTKQIWSSGHGIRGFYQGYGIALVSVTMHCVAYLGGYDYVKIEYAVQRGKQRKMSVMERLLAAQGVSMLASTIHYPLDSVRRRLMMEAGKRRNERIYRNTADCFFKVYQQEGIRGFYLGLPINLVRCIGSALVLVSYDGLKSLFFVSGQHIK